MSYTWPCQEHENCLINTKLADWGFLDGCFAEEPSVSASDIDGIVAQNRAVLILEKKPLDALNKDRLGLTWPQVKSFRILASQGNTVIAGWWDKRDASDLAKMMMWAPEVMTTEQIDRAMEAGEHRDRIVKAQALLAAYPRGAINADRKEFRKACRIWWFSRYNGRNNH